MLKINYDIQTTKYQICMIFYTCLYLSKNYNLKQYTVSVLD